MNSTLPCPSVPLSSLPCTVDNILLMQHARYGSRRRWWSDAWEDDPGNEPGGPSSLDGGSAARSEQVTTIFCSDGSVVQLGAVPNPALAELERRRQQRVEDGLGADLLGSAADGAAPLPLPREQGLCIGSVFTIRWGPGLVLAVCRWCGRSAAVSLQPWLRCTEQCCCKPVVLDAMHAGKGSASWHLQLLLCFACEQKSTPLPPALCDLPASH